MQINNVQQLYNVLNDDTQPDGLTLELKPGIYMLDPVQGDPGRKGRLEFRKDMTIVRDLSLNGEVVIDVSKLPPASYDLEPESPGGKPPRTGAIRMGFGNNTLSGITITNDWRNGEQIRALVQTDLGTDATEIRIENSILRGGSIGVSVANQSYNGRNITAHIKNNEFINNLVEYFKFGIQIKNGGPATYTIEVFSESNLFTSNGIGMVAFNEGGNGKTIIVRSKSDQFDFNYVGLVLYGALNGANKKASYNTTRFIAESMSITNSGKDSEATSNSNFIQSCGLFAAGSRANELTPPPVEPILERELSHNKLVVTLTDCTIKDNEGIDLEVYGEYEGAPTTAFRSLSNNTALVHCRTGYVGNYKVLNSNTGNNDGINLGSVVIEKTLPELVANNTFLLNHMSAPDGTVVIGSPGIIQLSDSYCIPVWRALTYLPNSTSPPDDQIRCREQNPLIVPQEEFSSAFSEPFVYNNRGNNTILVNNKAEDGGISAIRLGITGERRWENEDLLIPYGFTFNAGKPFGYMGPENINHIIYRSKDDHLHELYWEGFLPVAYGGNLTATLGNHTAASDPVAYFNGSNVVVYRTQDQEIISLYWNGTVDGHDHLNASSGSPKAINSSPGDPSAFYIDKYMLNQLVYYAEDENIYEISWTGNGQPTANCISDRLTNFPKPGSKLAFYYDQRSDTKHVVYRSGTQLFDIWWQRDTVDRKLDELSNRLHFPDATSDPVVVVTEDWVVHRFFTGVDGGIYESIDQKPILSHPEFATTTVG